MENTPKFQELKAKVEAIFTSQKEDPESCLGHYNINWVDLFRDPLKELISQILDAYYDELIDKGQCLLFQGQTKWEIQLSIFDWDDLERLIPCESEPGLVIMQQAPQEEVDFTLLTHFLLQAFALDCTECCNAISYITIDDSRALAYIETGQTYHS